MQTIPVVILDVGMYQSQEMALPEDDHVVKQLAPATADPAFLSRLGTPRALG